MALLAANRFQGACSRASAAARAACARLLALPAGAAGGCASHRDHMCSRPALPAAAAAALTALSTPSIPACSCQLPSAVYAYCAARWTSRGRLSHCSSSRALPAARDCSAAAAASRTGGSSALQVGRQLAGLRGEMLPTAGWQLVCLQHRRLSMQSLAHPAPLTGPAGPAGCLQQRGAAGCPPPGCRCRHAAATMPAAGAQPAACRVASGGQGEDAAGANRRRTAMPAQ